MISKFLPVALGALMITQVRAQGAPLPPPAPPAAAGPGLSGGDLSPQGYRDPVVRTGGDISRATVADGFTFAAGGDLLGPANPLSQQGDPEISRMLKLLQDADVGFANHEASSFDLPGPAGATQAAQNGGGYPRITAAINRDLKAMGIKMVSMANNHAGDWGPEGLLATLATVQASGLVQAGAGASMGDARRPGVVFTPRGTAALIATASTFNPATVAADGVGAVKPRPGISVLRARPVVTVSDEQMVLMRRLSAASWSPNYGVRSNGPNAVTIGGVTFRTSTDKALTYDVDKDDRQAIISSITRAKRGNDMVAFSIHAHEVAATGSTASVADFLPPLFHDAIDAGADIVLRHGPHALGGVEIYKGKPIFYGLNSLFFVVGGIEGALDPVRRVNTGFYDNMVAVTEFKGGRPSIVRIYPITTTFDRPATFGGSKIATGEDAQRILARIQKESEPFGTQIKVENGIGIIRLQ